MAKRATTRVAPTGEWLDLVYRVAFMGALNMSRQSSGRGLLAADIPPSECKLAKVDGEDVAIFNVEGKLYATQNSCTHAGGPLCEGALWGDTISCPWHGSEFNVRTGEVITGPASTPLKTYSVEISAESIHIREQ